MAADLSEILRSGAPLTTGQRLRLVAQLSWPAIMAQLSAILMEYIDASMVGSLGANASASIGLVATTTWLFWGLGGALSTGFSVQVAHQIGAGRDDAARSIFCQAITCVVALGVVLAITGISISGHLPGWLGGNDDINAGSTAYFAIVTASMPLCYLTFLASDMLRCSGNMIIPGAMNVAMCVMDVVFNSFLIFDTHTVAGITLPGAGLGVAGAALGTASAEFVTGTILLYYIMRRSTRLNFRSTRFSLRLKAATVKRALKISAPIGAERIMMCGAQILTTVIVAPLGTAAIAANSFGITAESLCYMPGYGISGAGTTLIGQSLGAGRRDLMRSFGKICITLGIVVMTVMGVVLWLGAPLMMSIFTPDLTVRALGTGALRIEAFAEPMFAAAIVTYGVMVGAGYTLVPSAINLCSIWVVRLSLAALLAPSMGLNGVWLAMCIELIVRGTVFLIVFARGRWMRKPMAIPSGEAGQLIESEKDAPYVE